MRDGAEPSGLGVLALWVGGAFLVALAGVLFLGQQRATLAERLAQNEALDAELAPLRALLGVDSMAEAQAEIDRRRALLDGLNAGRGEGAAVLSAVAGAVGNGAWLVALDWDGARVHLEGRGFDPVVAADVMEGLQRAGCFEEVQLISVDQPPGGGPQRFVIDALATDEPCGPTHEINPRPFTPPFDPARGPNNIHRPALLRWQADLYRVIAVKPGSSATLLDPDGRRHEIQPGAMLGAPAATVTFITDSTVILSLDELVNAETGALRSRILELPLDPPPEVDGGSE